jgi:iron-sulfur cluster assembly accessory protein
MIEVSASATQAIKAFFEDKKVDSSLRVFLQAGGCGGPALRLILDEAKESDLSYEVEGLTYLIDKELSEQSGAVKVDFVDDGHQQGFMLTSANPIAGEGGGCSCSGGGSCGC